MDHQDRHITETTTTFRTQEHKVLGPKFYIRHRGLFQQYLYGMDKFTCGNIIDDLQTQTGGQRRTQDQTIPVYISVINNLQSGAEICHQSQYYTNTQYDYKTEDTVNSDL